MSSRVSLFSFTRMPPAAHNENLVGERLDQTHSERIHLQMASLHTPVQSLSSWIKVGCDNMYGYQISEGKQTCLYACVCKGPISTESFNPHSTQFDLHSLHPHYFSKNIRHLCWKKSILAEPLCIFLADSRQYLGKKIARHVHSDLLLNIF